MAMAAAIDVENRLADDITGFYCDPLGFVRYAFPWGEAGTQLAEEAGPDEWQTGILTLLGEETRKRELNTALSAVQIAVASGHGVGKSALMAWIIIWFMSTREHPQIPVTANTSIQLETKTWRELAKWHKLAINRHWFDWTATRFYHKDYRETWFASAIPWSKERSEAFAGTHERNVLVLFDEASNIEDIIFEVTEGAMTTPGAVWICFGNPTRNTGRFKECFGSYRHRWITRQVDSRTAKKANQTQIEQWIADYGDDSDFVRVRVKGEFPRAGSNQMIASALVDAAAGKHLQPDVYHHAPRLLGVDVARYGEDQSVIIRRQGLAATGMQKFRGLDTMTFAGIIAQEIKKYQPHAVFIDEVGMGAGVVDRLRQLGHVVIGVNAGLRATNEHKYHNLRAEMWAKVRDWLEAGGAIPDDLELKADLVGPEYAFDGRDRVQLEKKEDMKKRGLASPDCADALAHTFSRDVAAMNLTVFDARSLPLAEAKAAYSLPDWMER